MNINLYHLSMVIVFHYVINKKRGKIILKNWLCTPYLLKGGIVCRDWRIASLAYEPVLTRTVSHRLYKPGSSANNAEFTSIYSVVTNVR